MKKLYLKFSCCFLVLNLTAQKIPLQSAQISCKLIAEKLVSPVGMAFPDDKSGRKFVIEQRGYIYIIDKNNQLLAEPFLDLKNKLSKLSSNYDERGLLGLAFHPNYIENGRFFIYYSSNLPQNQNDHIGVLSEFKVNPKDANKSLLEEKVILTIPQPEWNHNGGQILFDKQGYLLLGLGDGGSGGDPHGKIGNGQNIYSLLGKIIRIDINKTPYQSPTDNPFVNKDGADEIYAYGLRNPWRFSIDKTTNRLFCGDVGQNKYEEINIIEKGKNYGWRIMEGLHCFEPSKNCDTKNLVLPITEYDHSEGASVTGGFVYRGKKIPSLYGKYIFADWRGVLFSLTEMPDKTWKRDVLKTNFLEFKNLNINSLGEDADGEIYLIVQDLDGPFEFSGKVLLIN